MKRKLKNISNDLFAIPQGVVVGYGRSQVLQHKCYGCGELFFPTINEDVICDECRFGENYGEISVAVDNERYIKIIDFVQKISATTKRTKKNYKRVMLRDEFTCQYCKYSPRYVVESEQLTIDHIVPHVFGGNNSMDNLVVSCLWCNVHLSDKVFKEFMYKREYIVELAKKNHRPVSERMWRDKSGILVGELWR